MKHRELINFAKVLGYQSIANGNGLCQGFTMMWAQAVCANDLSAFQTRMLLLDSYKANPEILVADIQNIRNKLKNKNYVPTLAEQNLLEIPAFFDGIALYLSPRAHQDVFNSPKMTQSNEELISTYTAPLGKIGLKRAFSTIDQYTKKDLANFLANLGEKLEDMPDYPITFSSINHVVAARYLGNGKFEFIDTNSHTGGDIAAWTGDAIGLAEQLFVSLSHNKSWLPMKCNVVTPLNAPKIDFEACRNTKTLHELHSDDEGATVLHLACKTDDMNLLNRIDMQRVNVNQTYTGVTPLMLACEGKYINARDFLLSQNQTDINISHPEHGNILTIMITRSDMEGARRLLQDPRLKLPNNPPNLLHRLACNIRFPEISKDVCFIAEELLTKHKITANTEKGNYYSPLHIACAHGNYDFVELLLKHKANKNLQDDSGETPMHTAVRCKHMEMVNLLVKAGVDCNLKNAQGLTAFGAALKNGQMKIAYKLFPETNIDAQLLKEVVSLKSVACSPVFKKEILKKSLNDYIMQRMPEPQYNNIFNLGYSRDEKVAAAKALLMHIIDPDYIIPKHHIKILQDARLGQIYSASLELSKNQKISNQFKERLTEVKTSDTELDINSVNNGVVYQK